MTTTARRAVFARHVRRVALAASLTAVHCSGEIEGPAGEQNAAPLLAELIVSEPAQTTTPSGSSAAGSTFVSLPPGTLPLATSVEIRNATTGGAAVRIAVVNGGFDPVAIAATAGDRLDVTVTRRTARRAGSPRRCLRGGRLPSCASIRRRDGGTPQLLIAGGRDPAWSPDGTRIAFVRYPWSR